MTALSSHGCGGARADPFADRVEHRVQKIDRIRRETGIKWPQVPPLVVL
jgi:hypothetical protein